MVLAKKTYSLVLDQRNGLEGLASFTVRTSLSLLSRSVLETNYFSGSNVNNLCKKTPPFVTTFR
jgi:hypothetical protein